MSTQDQLGSTKTLLGHLSESLEVTPGEANRNGAVWQNITQEWIHTERNVDTELRMSFRRKQNMT